MVPVVLGLASSVAVPISIDTTKAAVAAQAIDAGATIINDISALGADQEMVNVAARTGAGVVLMHMQGVPRTMQVDPRYDDVVHEVYDFLANRLEWAESRGIPASESPSTPESASARRSSTIWRSCGTSSNLPTWDV